MSQPISSPEQPNASCSWLCSTSLLFDHAKICCPPCLVSVSLCLESLEAKRSTLGDRHRDTLASINDVAHLLQAQGKFQQAESLFREALEAKKETLGDRHPETLVSMGNMALIMQFQASLCLCSTQALTAVDCSL